MAVLDDHLGFDQQVMDNARTHERTPINGPGRSTLHAAAASGDARQVALVAAVRSDLDLCDAEGWSPLHLAASAGHAHAIAALLARGARADVRSRCPGGFDGCTPLHAAVAGGHAGATDLLLKAGADPCARDECGYTPLHLASELGRPDLIRLLLKAGARVDTTVGDVTPLGLARRSHHMEAAGLLAMVGAKL